MYHDDQLRQDIVDRFEELVNTMPTSEKRAKKTSLGGMTPTAMLKNLKNRTSIGNNFIDQMIAIAYQKVFGLGKLTTSTASPEIN